MVTHIARVWINRVPILRVASWTGKMDISLSAFAPEHLVSRDGYGSSVPRQPAHPHTQAESGKRGRPRSLFSLLLNKSLNAYIYSILYTLPLYTVVRNRLCRQSSVSHPTT